METFDRFTEKGRKDLNNFLAQLVRILIDNDGGRAQYGESLRILGFGRLQLENEMDCISWIHCVCFLLQKKAVLEKRTIIQEDGQHQIKWVVVFDSKD